MIRVFELCCTSQEVFFSHFNELVCQIAELLPFTLQGHIFVCIHLGKWVTCNHWSAGWRQWLVDWNALLPRVEQGEEELRRVSILVTWCNPITIAALRLASWFTMSYDHKRRNHCCVSAHNCVQNKWILFGFIHITWTIRTTPPSM